MRFIKFLITIYLLTIISCSPSLGASWYAKSGSKSTGISMYVTSIKVLDKDVTVSDPDYRATEGDQVINFAKAKRFSISVPNSVKAIDIDSIKIEAYGDYKKQNPLKISLEIEGDSVPLVAGEAVSVILRVKDDRGKYSVEQKFISVTRETSQDPEAPSEPDPEEPDEPSEPEPPAVENPVDENGQKKFNVKINVKKEEVDPFDWYKENTFFSASLFNGWILNMTGMTSDNVASYAFKEGEWSGSPLSCSGDDIGQGQLNHTWNLKYYKYKDQEERWQERGGYNSSIDEAEKKRRERFIFFRFTGNASAGTRLDNSMFCVDTHTKFLFYYSDPSHISSFGVPSGWKDYDEADEGEHKYFDKPFYLTDPVGYVKENGECVIYGWCKQHIRNNNYRATVDGTYRKQASRTSGGKGYSPYRDKKIKTTKERIVEENPLYTAEKPVITKQSGSLYLTLDSPDEAKLSVTVKKAPENEELSFQWYKNTVNSSEGAVAIDGANVAEYVMPKEIIDVYCYCVVTNKNTKNNKEAKTLSAPIKLRIAKNSEELKIDAETPIITKHPKSSKHSFVEGKSINVSLSVEVNKPKDNGTLSYQWFESKNEGTGSETKIENATEKTYKTELSDSGVKYYYCVITNTNNNASGEKSVSIASAVAKIEIEQLYELAFGCVGEGSLTVFGGENGKKVVKNGAEETIQVKTGSELIFVAKPNSGWEIEKWDGKVIVSEDKKTSQMKIENKGDVAEPVVVNFRKIQKQGKLGIMAARVENVSIDCKFWGKYYYGSYFYWDIIESIKDDGAEEVSQELWNQDRYTFLYIKGSGKSAYFMPEKNAKLVDVSVNNNEGKLKLDFKITKRDSGIPIGGDHTWTMIDHGKGTVEFDYDTTKDCWRVKDMNYDIDKVEVSYRKDFILKRGEEKDFTVTYTADNPDLSAVGSLKVVYTLLWE